MQHADLKSRDRILLAARDLLWEHGVSGTTTHMIAEKAGVNPVTVFRIFKSKEKLMWEIITAVSEAELTKLAEILARQFGSLEEFFGAINASFIESFLPMHKTFSAVITDINEPDNVFCPYVLEITSRLISAIANKLEQLCQLGLLRKVDFTELALLHFHYSLGSSLSMRPNNLSFSGKPIQQSIETMTHILIAGIRPETIRT